MIASALSCCAVMPGELHSQHANGFGAQVNAFLLAQPDASATFTSVAGPHHDAADARDCSCHCSHSGVQCWIVLDSITTPCAGPIFCRSSSQHANCRSAKQPESR